MKIVIDIPEETVNKIKDNVMFADNISSDIRWDITSAIVNGTPLPKGHGRLIDADEFLKENKDYTGWILCSDAWGGENAYNDTLEDLINDVPTIIEADKESD